MKDREGGKEAKKTGWGGGGRERVNGREIRREETGKMFLKIYWSE